MITASHPETTLQVEPQPAPTPNDTRILIIDDDRDQSDALAYCLRRQGFTADTAHLAREGLKKAFQHHPDLIVLDIRLPDMNGMDVCAELADNVNTCCTPVIMVSAMERPDIVRAARAVGSRFYVRKPYDPNALFVLIRQALDENHELSSEYS